MTRVVEVPLNTAIADLDEALRTLLKRELDRHGFDGVEIAFDAPSKEWSGKLTGPTVDLFLYDLREAIDRASATPGERRGNGVALISDPPLHLELTYAVTAWTKAVEDDTGCSRRCSRSCSPMSAFHTRSLRRTSRAR